MGLLNEFKPSLLFLTRFLAVYFIGNILYGVYVESFGDRPDTLTRAVSQQTAVVINMFGDEHATIQDSPNAPRVLLNNSAGTVLRVYEGCNGLNVIIVFVAFLVAFGGPLSKMGWFVPAGILVIHFFNLLRVSLLYYVAVHLERYFYFFHKYFFTAILYTVVFALWILWVLFFNRRSFRFADAW
jgi:exosortase family protein XrtF